MAIVRAVAGARRLLQIQKALPARTTTAIAAAQRHSAVGLPSLDDRGRGASSTAAMN